MENIEELKTQEQETQDNKEAVVETTKGKNILMAVLCYLGILILVPLLTEAKKDPFVKFHIKQGLILIIAMIINFFISMVPIIGWVVGSIVWLIILVIWLIGLINVISGKESKLLIIGGYGDRLKI